MKIKLDHRKRALIAGVAVLALLASGAAYWQRDVSESRLLEVGRSSSTAFLKTRLRKVAASRLLPVSRRFDKSGDLILRYEVSVDRKELSQGMTNLPGADRVSGQVILPIEVRVGKAAVADVLGLKRQAWKHRDTRLGWDEKTANGLWTQIKDEPENARFDAAFFEGDLYDGRFHVVQLAAALGAGEHRDAIRVIENSYIWSEQTVWTPEWAKRLDDEMAGFQKDVDEGRVAPHTLPAARKAIYHYAHNPKLAAFREKFQKMLTASNGDMT